MKIFVGNGGTVISGEDEPPCSLKRENNIVTISREGLTLKIQDKSCYTLMNWNFTFKEAEDKINLWNCEKFGGDEK